MKRFFSFLFWSLVFLGLLVGIDQFFVRVPTEVPGLVEARTFYLEFRQRIRSLVMPKKEDALGKVIEGAVGQAKRAARHKASSPRFLYVDSQGQLQFADTLEEIPAELRSQAQPLEQ